MKKVVICTLFTLCSLCGSAQTPQDIGKVMLGVKIAEDATTETKSLSMQLQSRLSQIATQAGYSSNGTSLFAIYPNVIVNDVNIAEGGMKSIYVVQGDVAITISGGTEGTVFSSTIIPFKGSATDKNKAVMNGVLKVGYGHVKEMFDKARVKILDYYAAKEDMIFAKAESFAFNHQYDEAIACLMLVPEELFDLHKKALAKATEIYDQRNQELARQRVAQLSKENDAVLKKAQSFISMQKAEDALRALWDYRDGSDKQNAQYKSLVEKAGSLVSEEKQRILAAERQKYLDARMREDREWAMRVQATEHKMSLDNREMNMKEQAAEHDIKIEDKMTDHKVRMDNRKMDYDFAALDANTQTEQQKIDAVKTVACEFIKKNPNFISNLK